MRTIFINDITVIKNIKDKKEKKRKNKIKK